LTARLCSSWSIITILHILISCPFADKEWLEFYLHGILCSI
jgi:hypothetical protein